MYKHAISHRYVKLAEGILAVGSGHVGTVGTWSSPRVFQLRGQLGRLHKPLAAATLLEAVQRSRGDVNVIHYNAACFWRFHCVLNTLSFKQMQQDRKHPGKWIFFHMDFSVSCFTLFLCRWWTANWIIHSNRKYSKILEKPPGFEFALESVPLVKGCSTTCQRSYWMVSQLIVDILLPNWCIPPLLPQIYLGVK